MSVETPEVVIVATHDRAEATVKIADYLLTGWRLVGPVQHTWIAESKLHWYTATLIRSVPV